MGSNSISTLVVVIIAVVITLVISITLTSIVMIVLVKTCLLKKTQQSPVIQVSPVNNIIAADVKIERNPAYQVIQKDYSYIDKDDYYY